ncbi:hypothetical protein FVEG_16220 [Fusarium verticillioides 7600]|uniref:Uncharacterized protein n=1 Tax=Gibberella moniliformis (strain M3125 / FGSC 7600) TaxID=334819 RepID=W7MAE1_GIBM7|nr:hypothetical protein FVEG_16220 [Fusarium verticillioides 7600]EWG47956.1 hypothetical protein FVEG_16220 [Fusarium verticillioides 7600]
MERVLLQLFMVRLANIESLAYIRHAYVAQPPVDDDDDDDGLPFGRFHHRHEASSPLLFREYQGGTTCEAPLLSTYSSGAGSVGIDGSWRQMRTQRSNVRSSFGSARLTLALQRRDARVAVVRQLGRNRTRLLTVEMSLSCGTWILTTT